MRMTQMTAGLGPALVLGLLLCGCPQKDKAAPVASQPPGGSSASGSPDAGGAVPPAVDPPAAPAPSAWTGNAQDFSYRDASGKVHKLSEHAGKPIVVDFWAVW